MYLELLKELVNLISVCVWPSVVIFFLIFYREKIRLFFDYLIKNPLKQLSAGPVSATWAEESVVINETKSDETRVQGEREETVEFEDTLMDIINAEYDIEVLKKMVSWILTNNNAFVKDLTSEELTGFREAALKKVKEKHPGAKIRLSQKVAF